MGLRVAQYRDGNGDGDGRQGCQGMVKFFMGVGLWRLSEERHFGGKTRILLSKGWIL